MALYKQEPAAPKTRLIGNAQVGIIEVPVLGGLTIEEDETIDELYVQGGSVFVLASKMAEQVVLVENQGKGEDDQKLSIVEAYQILEDAVGAKVQEPEARAIAMRHAEAVIKLREALNESTTLRDRATVTAILRHRLGVQEVPAGFPRVLFKGLVKLAEDEQATEKLPAEPITAKALGKLPGATRARKKRTGTPASGS